MILQLIKVLVAAGILLGATSNAWAMPPRTHSVSGVVDAIDCVRRTITLKTKNGAAPVTFVWDDSTRFTTIGGCAKCSFDSGQTVRVSYRRWVGQNVIRELSMKGTPAGCGAVCK